MSELQQSAADAVTSLMRNTGIDAVEDYDDLARTIALSKERLALIARLEAAEDDVKRLRAERDAYRRGWESLRAWCISEGWDAPVTTAAEAMEPFL